MNEMKIYKNIIKKAKFQNRKKGKNEYFELHHIIPKSIMKSKGKPKCIWNGSWNKVLLTAQEHFIVHFLLWKYCQKKYGNLHEYTIKMCSAINNFIIRPQNSSNNLIKINSKIYSEIKKENAKIVSKRFKGRKNSEETKKRKSMAALGKPKSKESTRKSIETKKRKGICRGENNPCFGKFGSNHPRSRIYELEFDNHNTIIVDDLAQWCIRNGYTASNISAVCNSRLKKHKDIIKVTRLDI